MRKYFVTFMASLLSCSAAFAFLPEATESPFELGVGYRRDKFSWNTETELINGDVPVNFVSKHKWHDLKIWQIDAKVKYVTCDNIYFRACADYGWVTSGKFKNQFYVDLLPSPINSGSGSGSGSGSRSGSELGSGSVGSDAVEVFDFTASADKGHVYDATLALGYQFKTCDDSFAIAPVVGYSWNGQHLEIGKEGSGSGSSEDYSYSDASYSDDYSSDNSKYNARWNGPFIGVDFDYNLGCDWELFATYEFHWARYHAKSHWNHQVSYEDGFNHRAKNGHGQVASVGVKYDFCECWTASLVGEWKYFHANRGTHKFLAGHESNGDLSTDCYVYMPLKHAVWQSASVSVNVGMLF